MIRRLGPATGGASRVVATATAGAILLLVALSIALRFLWLDADAWFPNPSYANPLSINFEEKASAIPARNWVLFGEIDSFGGSYQPQAMMPLGFLIHAAWYRGFGVSLLQTRLPFVLLGVATFIGMILLARRQLEPAPLLAFVGAAGLNQTLLAYQRSCLDENLFLAFLTLAAFCRPGPEGRARTYAVWGLLAFLALAAKPTGVIYAAAPALALAIDLLRDRRGRAWKPLLALGSGLAAAAGGAFGLYAALGFLRQNAFTAWLGTYNKAMGHVPPLSGFGDYLHALERHLPVPEAAERPVLVLALVAPLLLRRTTFFTRAAWWTFVLAVLSGAPTYLYYKRVVPLAPVVFYLAAAAGQGILERLAVAPETLFLRKVRRLAWGGGAAVWVFCLLSIISYGTRLTAFDLLERGPVRSYRATSAVLRAAVPPEARLAAPDAFRLVAFDTPFRYRFTHDMAARHVEKIDLGQAALRDACAGGADVLVEARDDPSDPGRQEFAARPFDRSECPRSGQEDGGARGPA